MPRSLPLPLSWRTSGTGLPPRSTKRPARAADSRDRRGRNYPYGKPGKHSRQTAYGRSDVQLTRDYNYQRADDELGLKDALTSNCDRALGTAISAQIMVLGLPRRCQRRRFSSPPFAALSTGSTVPSRSRATHCLSKPRRSLAVGHEPAFAAVAQRTERRLALPVPRMRVCAPRDACRAGRNARPTAPALQVTGTEKSPSGATRNRMGSVPSPRQWVSMQAQSYLGWVMVADSTRMDARSNGVRI